MITTPKPSVDFPLSAASEELTGFETIAIESKFGRRLDELGLGQMIVGFVWAFENRTSPTTWDAVMKRTQREMTSYFAPEPDMDDDEDDPKD